MKKVFNFFGIVLALILSLVLIPALIMNPVWRGVSGLLQPETISDLTTQLVQEIDFSEVSLDDPELAAVLTEFGITQEAAQAILTSETAARVLPLLGQDLAQVVEGSFSTSALTEAEVLRIAADNRLELIDLMRMVAPAEMAGLSDEPAGLVVDYFVQEEILPLLGDLNAALLDFQTQLHSELDQVIELATSPLISQVLLIASVILAVLIFLLRWPQQKGLLWLGIDCALAALAVLGIAVPMKGAQISQALAQGTGLPDVFDPVLQRLAAPILTGGIILAAAAIVLVAAFILLRDRRMKKAAAAQAAYEPVYSAPAATCIPTDSTDTPAGESAETAEVPVQRSPWDNV